VVSKADKRNKTQQLKAKLRAQWEKHIGSPPPGGVNSMARGLCEKLGIEITPSKKMAYSVLEKTSGIPPICQLIDSKRKTTPKAARFTPLSSSPSKEDKAAFYASWEWRTLRMEVIKEFGAICMCCGATPRHKDMSGEPVQIVVDHIKPLSKHWGLRLDRTNLQILCAECNQGKGAWDETDHRQSSVSDNKRFSLG
jgi:5-methylcytosine-specific restriction endonuclease McrA